MKMYRMNKNVMHNKKTFQKGDMLSPQEPALKFLVDAGHVEVIEGPAEQTEETNHGEASEPEVETKWSGKSSNKSRR